MGALAVWIFWAVPRDPRATPTVSNSPIAEASGPGGVGKASGSSGFFESPLPFLHPWGGVRERIANYDVKDAPLP